MLTVILPDGSSRKYNDRVRPIDVAADIGPGLAKAVVAAAVDDQVIGADIWLPTEGEVNLRLLTKRDAESLDVMRHSCAHIMARAIMRRFEGVQLAFGPTTDGGFYYDFDLPHALSEEDFADIEAEMGKIIKANEPFERIEEPRAKAIEICQDLKQTLKVEHIETGLAEHPELSFYRQGEFIDLCRGPHVVHPKSIGAFKVLSVAGAYWKGDQSNQQLQRVYGTAFFDKKELADHLEKIEEARRRDHRVLGKQLELFTIDPMVGSGLILWLPKGAVIRSTLEDYVRQELRLRGYETVYTPNVGKIDLYETSGHFPYYRESQFAPIYEHASGGMIDEWKRRVDDQDETLSEADEKAFLDGAVALGIRSELLDAYAKSESDEQKSEALGCCLEEHERFLLKPMNCPHHIKIFQSKPRSYRDLPVRLAEFGTVYRYEKSGELSGMTRVRGFTQDDAHIFCTDDQVADEFRSCIEMTQGVLAAMGMSQYRVRLGFRDPNSDKYVGSAEVWDKAETALEQVCREMDLPDLSIEQGEAAFYGPKADFVVVDCLGREWQLGTVQLDYNLPSAERFDLEYIGADNSSHRPVMIHRAPLGSLERFIGVLIEHFAGAFPLWLAPEQVRVLTVSEKSEEYGREVHRQLLAAGLRAEADFRGEKLGHKIRDAQLQKIPYMFIVGPKDVEAGAVSVRDRIEGDLGAISLAEAVDRLQVEIREKTVRQVVRAESAGFAERGGQHEY